MANLRVIAIAGLLLAALVAPHFIYPVFLMRALVFSLLACSVNLLFGYLGLLSFGHAAFYGTAAYFTGYAVKTWGFPPELGIAAGVCVAAALGLLIGGLAIRRSGIYFAMITFALAEVVHFIANDSALTGGENGLTQVPRGRLFGMIDLSDQMSMYYFTLGVFLLGFLFTYRVVRSPFGQVMMAVRDNEARAVSLGYPVERVKLLAFVLSAGLAGLAGGLKTMVMTFASLSDVHWHTSGEAVMATLLGGLGTLTGPVVGGFILVSLQNYLAETAEWATIIIGAIFMLFVLALRRGVVGELPDIVRRLRRPKDRPSASAAVSDVAVDAPAPHDADRMSEKKEAWQ